MTGSDYFWKIAGRIKENWINQKRKEKKYTWTFWKIDEDLKEYPGFLKIYKKDKEWEIYNPGFLKIEEIFETDIQGFIIRFYKIISTKESILYKQWCTEWHSLEADSKTQDFEKGL